MAILLGWFMEVCIITNNPTILSVIGFMPPAIQNGEIQDTIQSSFVITSYSIHYTKLYEISLGMDHLITYQIHSDKSKTIFDPCLCSVDDVPAVSLLQKYLCDSVIRDIGVLETQVSDSWLFCSVDAGGEKVARRFSTSFGTQLVVAHKQRNNFV